MTAVTMATVFSEESRRGMHLGVVMALLATFSSIKMFIWLRCWKACFFLDPTKIPRHRSNILSTYKPMRGKMEKKSRVSEKRSQQVERLTVAADVICQVLSAWALC